MISSLRLVSIAAVLIGALSCDAAGAEKPKKLSRDLYSGWQLNAGDSLFSSLAAFRLVMQEDGNLVLYAVDDMRLPVDLVHVLSGAPDVLALYAKPIWSTGTHVPRQGKGRGRCCVMEEDGNLVVYDQDQHPVFETGTAGHRGAFLRLQNDGNLVVYTPDMQAPWFSNTSARPHDRDRPTREQDVLRRRQEALRRVAFKPRGLPARLSKDLRPRWRLNRGDSLYSPLAGFRLTMESDGNLLLYIADDQALPWDVSPVVLLIHESPGIYENPFWSSGTNVPGTSAGAGDYCVMEDNGNFVVYDARGRPRFQTGTSGNPGAFLRCQDDGNLVIYTRQNKPIWQSKTYARTEDVPSPN
jgi:hypothetical protein